MANSDSRHSTPTLRWGETTGEVVDANVVEPSGGKKNTGWIPAVDGAVAEWFNWLWYAAGAMFRYIEKSRAKMWTRNHLMRGAGAGEGAVTNGVGLSLNVTSAAVWVDGAMYQVPAATNLALAAADPTDDRIDLVIARVTAGAPEFAIVTGTPAPAPEAPALPAGAVAIAEVEVDAADTIPGSATDRRLFGAISMDLLRADKQFVAGDMGAQSFLVVEDLGAAWSFKAGGSNNPILEISDFGRSFLVDANNVIIDAPSVTITPEAVEFDAPITRKFDLGPGDFTQISGAVAGAVRPDGEGPGTIDTQTLYLTAFSDGGAVAPVRIPNGATITAWRVYGSKPDTGELLAAFSSRVKATGVNVLHGTADTTALGVGVFTIGDAGLSIPVDQDSVYMLALEFTENSGSCFVWAAEVEYEETKPFDGL